MELQRYVNLDAAVEKQLFDWLATNWVKKPAFEPAVVTTVKQLVTTRMVEWFKYHSNLELEFNPAEMSVNCSSETTGFELTVKANFAQFHKTFLRFDYYVDEYKKETVAGTKEGRRKKAAPPKPEDAEDGKLGRCAPPEEWVQEVLASKGFPTLREKLTEHFSL